jgi:hypothetical protein
VAIMQEMLIKKMWLTCFLWPNALMMMMMMMGFIHVFVL